MVVKPFNIMENIVRLAEEAVRQKRYELRQLENQKADFMNSAVAVQQQIQRVGDEIVSLDYSLNSLCTRFKIEPGDTLSSPNSPKPTYAANSAPLKKRRYDDDLD